MRIPRRRPARVVALACAAIVALAGCARPSPELQTLRREKIATAPVPGTDQGSTLETRGGTTFGKPIHATLTRQLPVRAGSDPEQVLATAIGMIRADGWTPAGGADVEGGARLFRKTVGDQRLELGASVQDPQGRRTLVLNLTNQN